MNERRFTNNKSSVGAPNSRENTAAEYPVVRVTNKKKQQKRPEDGRYIILKKNKMWTKNLKSSIHNSYI
jgi:hypothetical protein